MTERLMSANYVVIGEMYQSFTMRDQLLSSLDQLKQGKWLQVLAIDALKTNEDSGTSNYLKQMDSMPSSLAYHYRPFVLWANQNDVVLLGASTPKEKLNGLRKPEGQQWIEQQTLGVLTRHNQQTLQNILNEAHPVDKQDQNKNRYLLAAHKLNDYFMARLITSTTQNTLLLTRAFHARKDLGVEPYIQKLKPGSKITTVLMLGSEYNQELPSDQINSMKQYYDYVWLQKPEQTPLLAPKGQDK